MDQKQITERVKQAWGGARGGKIARLDETDDPRLFQITTLNAFDLDKAKFGAHGLSYVGHEKDMFGTGSRVTIRVGDDLWNKLEQGEAAAQTPAVPAHWDVQPDVTTVAQALHALQTPGTIRLNPETLQKAAQTLANAIAGAQSRVEDAERGSEALRRQNERLHGQLDDDAQQIGILTTKLEELTNAPESIHVRQIVSYDVQKANVLTEKRAEGYELVFESYEPVGPNADVVWCGRMERRAHTPGEPPHARMIEKAESLDTFMNGSGLTSATILDQAGGRRLADHLLAQDDQQNASVVAQLLEKFG